MDNDIIQAYLWREVIRLAFSPASTKDIKNWIVSFVFVMYLAYKNWFTWHVKWKYIRDALDYGLPLVPHALAGWALLASDRLILEHYVSLTELGLYNFGYKLGMVMSFLVYGIKCICSAIFALQVGQIVWLT